MREPFQAPEERVVPPSLGLTCACHEPAACCFPADQVFALYTALVEGAIERRLRASVPGFDMGSFMALLDERKARLGVRGQALGGGRCRRPLCLYQSDAPLAWE